MNVTITNNGPLAVPVVTGTASSEGEALALVEQGATYAISDDAVSVVSVGDNPSFFEEVKESLANIAEVLKRLAWWREHKPDLQAGESGVNIEIANAGPNPLRVLSDSNTNESFIVGGASGTATATRYVEIREQGT
jgi:hypothetical protein